MRRVALRTIGPVLALGVLACSALPVSPTSLPLSAEDALATAQAILTEEAGSSPTGVVPPLPTAVATPAPTSGPAVFSTGTLTIGPDDSADFEGGMVQHAVLTQGGPWDVYMLAGSGDLSGPFPAAIASTPLAAPSLEACTALYAGLRGYYDQIFTDPTTRNEITAAALTPGQSFCYRTNEGRIGHFRVVDHTAPAGPVTVEFVTYDWVQPTPVPVVEEEAPSPLPMMNTGLILREGECFDLDDGSVGAPDGECDLLLVPVLIFRPVNGARISGSATAAAPTRSQCASASLDAADVAPNTDRYLCLQTSEGTYGFVVQRADAPGAPLNRLILDYWLFR